MARDTAYLPSSFALATSPRSSSLPLRLSDRHLFLPIPVGAPSPLNTLHTISSFFICPHHLTYHPLKPSPSPAVLPAPSFSPTIFTLQDMAHNPFLLRERGERTAAALSHGDHCRHQTSGELRLCRSGIRDLVWLLFRHAHLASLSQEHSSHYLSLRTRSSHTSLFVHGHLLNCLHTSSPSLTHNVPSSSHSGAVCRVGTVRSPPQGMQIRRS